MPDFIDTLYEMEILRCPGWDKVRRGRFAHQKPEGPVELNRLIRTLLESTNGPETYPTPLGDLLGIHRRPVVIQDEWKRYWACANQEAVNALLREWLLDRVM